MDSVAIAGTGNLGQALALLLRKAGLDVRTIGGRQAHELVTNSRHILVAVPDDAIESVARQLLQGGLHNAIVLHTSGSAGPEALFPLRTEGCEIGVLHPLQSIPSPERGVEALPGSTFAYAGDPEACDWALALIRLLNGIPLLVDPKRWQQYHAAAVMVCNYHATLVESALELMTEAGIDRGPALEALAPLIRTTTHNILTSGPAAALTGPIRRGDTGTVRRHLAALKNPEILALYKAAGISTVRLANLAEGPAAELRHVLRHLIEDAIEDAE